MTFRVSRTVAVSRLTIFTVVLISTLSFSQAARVTESIDNNIAVRLPRTHHPLAVSANDRGRVSGDVPMGRMVLVLKPSARQASAISSLINGLQSKQSPTYRNWRTPEQYGAQFGPAQQDVDKIAAWLQEQGFRVDAV